MHCCAFVPPALRKNVYSKTIHYFLVILVKKRPEEQIKNLLARHAIPPLEVIIPILRKAGHGEQELTQHMYDLHVSITKGMQKILNLKDNDMKTAAKIFELICVSSGQKIEPIGLSQTRFALSVSDCPMLHVGKDLSKEVKGRFCDLFCSAGSKAIFDTVLGPTCTCSWDKKLIKGAGKCTVIFELGKAK
jgi:hypothetical protein